MGSVAFYSANFAQIPDFTKLQCHKKSDHRLGDRSYFVSKLSNLKCSAS